MIDLAIARFHGENVARLTKIDNTLENQNASIQKLHDGQRDMKSSVDLLVSRDTSVDKVKLWKALKWWVGILLTIIALILTYLGIKAKTGHEISKAPTALSQNFDATLK